MRRRHWLGLALLAAGGAGRAHASTTVQRGRGLQFPRDHGAHLESNIEWWYLTGDLRTPDNERLGFQITFFRRRTGLAAQSRSRFAARQLLFAHAALSDIGQARHRHAQRIARWSGDETATLARASARDS